MPEKTVGRQTVGVLAGVDHNLRLHAHRGLSILNEHEDIVGGEAHCFILKALRDINGALSAIEAARKTLGIDEFWRVEEGEGESHAD